MIGYPTSPPLATSPRKTEEEREEALLRALEGVDCMTTRSLAEKCGLSVHVARTVASRLKKQGKIENVSSPPGSLYPIAGIRLKPRQKVKTEVALSERTS